MNGLAKTATVSVLDGRMSQNISLRDCGDASTTLILRVQTVVSFAIACEVMCD
jgi:hypothetical protein